MALLPDSTNRDYRGAAISAWFLVLMGIGTVAPGCIHYFLPDGGAGVIAHIDLGAQAHTIVAVFAWFGALQIPHGVAEVVIGLRYRPLTPLFLALIIVERGLMLLDGWFLKGAGGHHPPEHYASVVVVALTLVFLALSLRGKA
ncbi:hypothetical protein [Phenylobacterium aquaticum]|uniref:hypothetical protein n=1 Tax=Phenylobacterium aquaticum TaxID=1763816 RepID=UPI0026F1F353|nr:hypothetical protein [Phenylobacterium aquaticum]